MSRGSTEIYFFTNAKTDCEHMVQNFLLLAAMDYMLVMVLPPDGDDVAGSSNNSSSEKNFGCKAKARTAVAEDPTPQLPVVELQ